MEPSQGPAAAVDPARIALMFVERYYKVLEMAPQALFRFYNEQSSVSINYVDANGSSHCERASGLALIADKFVSTAIRGAVATTQHLDAQHSASGGIMLQVTGAMKMQGVDNKFTQSFFLAPQENGFFVLNDIIRIEPVQYAPAAPVLESAAAVPAAEQVQKPAAVPQQPPSAVAQPSTYDTAPVQQQQQQPQQQPQAPVQQQQVQVQQPATPAPEPAAPAAAAVQDVEVPQPAKQATPPRPVAPPVPTNLTYAQRLRLSSPVPAGLPASPAPAEPVQAPSEVHTHSSEAAGNGHVEPPRQLHQPVHGVFCKGLPGDDVTVEMLEAEFSKFGALLGGKDGITIVAPKFGAVKTAQIRFESTAAVEAALRAEVVVSGKVLSLTRLRPDYGPPPRGGMGGRGAPGGRGGLGGRFSSSNPRVGAGRGPHDFGGRGGRGERPDSGRGERHVRSNSSEHADSNGPPSGAGSHERERPSSGSGRDERRERPRPSDRERRPGMNSRRGGGRSGGGGGSGGGGIPQSSSKDDVVQVAAAAAPEQ